MGVRLKACDQGRRAPFRSELPDGPALNVLSPGFPADTLDISRTGDRDVAHARYMGASLAFRLQPPSTWQAIADSRALGFPESALAHGASIASRADSPFAVAADHRMLPAHTHLRALAGRTGSRPRAPHVPGSRPRRNSRAGEQGGHHHVYRRPPAAKRALHSRAPARRRACAARTPQPAGTRASPQCRATASRRADDAAAGVSGGRGVAAALDAARSARQRAYCWSSNGSDTSRC